MDFTEYSLCECGAVTVYEPDGTSYSCKRRNMKKYLPGVDLRKLKKQPDTGCCDHCVNHFGLDLCGCGSGDPVGKCRNRRRECRHPMQVVGQYNHVRAPDALCPW